MAGLRAISNRCALNAGWVKIVNRSYQFPHDHRSFEGRPADGVLDQYETKTDADMRHEPDASLQIHNWRIEDGEN